MPKAVVSCNGLQLHKGKKPYFSFDANPAAILYAHRLPELIKLRKLGEHTEDYSALGIIISDAFQKVVTSKGMTNEDVVMLAHQMLLDDRKAERKAPTKNLKPIEGAAGLASILSSIAPNQEPEALAEMLDNLVRDYRMEAINLLTKDAKGNARTRNEDGYLLLRKPARSEGDEELEAFLSKEEASEVIETEVNSNEAIEPEAIETDFDAAV